MTERARAAAQRFVSAALASNSSIAVAESLTGGWLASTLVDVPGVSAVFRGGVVTYQTEAKRDVLGVDAALLAEVGAVDPGVAAQMAERVRRLFSRDGDPAAIGLATTGVAGPSEQDGHPVGEVFVAASSESGTRVEHLLLTGDRESIRAQTVAAVLALAAQALDDEAAAREASGTSRE